MFRVSHRLRGGVARRLLIDKQISEANMKPRVSSRFILVNQLPHLCGINVFKSPTESLGPPPATTARERTPAMRPISCKPWCTSRAPTRPRTAPTVGYDVDGKPIAIRDANSLITARIL